MNDESTHDVASAQRNRGATAVEYALIIALIAGVIILAVTTLGTTTQGMYQDVETEFEDNGI